MVPEIVRIFAKPEIPKHIPVSTVPEYPAAMHAKYELMRLTILGNPFRTRYFCWVDIGLFRHIASEPVNGTRFSLALPNGFRQDSVAYTEVSDRDPNHSAQEIIYNNLVWVCGCFFIGEASVLRRWTEEYLVKILQFFTWLHIS